MTLKTKQKLCRSAEPTSTKFSRAESFIIPFFPYFFSLYQFIFEIVICHSIYNSILEIISLKWSCFRNKWILIDMFVFQRLNGTNFHRQHFNKLILTQKIHLNISVIFSKTISGGQANCFICSRKLHPRNRRFNSLLSIPPILHSMLKIINKPQ